MSNIQDKSDKEVLKEAVKTAKEVNDPQYRNALIGALLKTERGDQALYQLTVANAQVGVAANSNNIQPRAK